MEFSRGEKKYSTEPLHLNKTLTEVCKVDPEVMLIADENEKPVWLKQKFNNIFHLNIRIYKKIGGIRWKEVPETEELNLTEINKNCEKLQVKVH